MNANSKSLYLYTRIKIYNEGLLVYLYDDSNLYKLGCWDEIESWIEDSRNNQNKSFAPAKKLVAYELMQDDSICADITVREPLSQEEKKELFTMQPLTTFLELPSGTLCVECANSFRLDPDYEEEIFEKGGVVEVPPGDYVVNVYHVDLEMMSRWERKQYEGPLQYIVLTPATEYSKPVKPKIFLPYFFEKAASDKRRKFDTQWVGKYTIKDKVFHGHFIDTYNIKEPCINLDRDAEIKMGLRMGCRILVEFGKVRIDMIYMSRLDRCDYGYFYGREKRDLIENISKCRMFRDADGIEKLYFSHLTGKNLYYFIKGIPKPGTPVKVNYIKDPEEPALDLELLDDWKVENSVIFCRVIASSKYAITLNTPPEAFKMIGAGDGGKLELDFGNSKHVLYYNVSSKKLQPAPPDRIDKIERQVKKVESGLIDVLTGDSQDYPDEEWEKLKELLFPPEEYPWTGETIEYWESPEHKVLILKPLVIRDLEMTRYTLVPEIEMGRKVVIRKI